MNSKVSRFKVPTAATQNISAIARSATTDEDVVMDIPVASIVPDPTNSRRILLDWENPAHIAEDDPLADEKRQELEDLKELAASIAHPKVGLISPISVIRRGEQYHLTAGYRRTMAHKLIGKTIIKAVVKRNVLRKLAQFVENAQRKDNDLSERLVAVRAVLEEIGVPVTPQTRPVTIQERLTEDAQMARATAFRWAAVITAPAPLAQAIADGLVTSLRQAEGLAKLSEDELNDELAMLQAGDSAADQGEEGQGAEAAGPTSKSRAPAGGGVRRNRDFVNLGKVRNPKVVQHLVEKVLGDDAPKDIDWNNLKQVKKAFDAMVDRINEMFK